MIDSYSDDYDWQRHSYLLGWTSVALLELLRGEPLAFEPAMAVSTAAVYLMQGASPDIAFSERWVSNLGPDLRLLAYHVAIEAVELATVYAYPEPTDVVIVVPTLH